MQTSDSHEHEPSELLSPVEERHIDYILEEEFSVSPEFLTFFLDKARLSTIDKTRVISIATSGQCKAARSATTEDGESDLIVTYGGDNGGLPVAILIENKIRARFQPKQPERYRIRGEAGKGKDWSSYWTCLVAHSKYTTQAGDFDAVVTLDTLQSFFAERKDDRSQFRAGILQRAIQKYEKTGIQKIDADMTRFRALYAAACEMSLRPGQWWFEPARDAW